MRLTESERAENREALSKMGLSAKLGYVFEYYRFPLVLALIAAVALGSVLYYRLTRKEALLFVGFANIAVGDDLDRALNENTVILEDNDIEHRLDEAVPYSAVTESVANGLLISAFPLFEGAEFSGDVYLGAIGNSARSDAVLRYIDYLTTALPHSPSTAP